MVTWISFALGFIATPISTRLFAPAELARVSMFGTYTSLFCSVCYLGLDQAFVRFFRETPGRMTPRTLLTFCLSVALGFGVVSSAVLLGFWRSLSGEIVGQPDFSIFLCLCLIILNNHFGRENDSLNALLCTMAAVEFYVRFTFTKKISDLVLALIGTVSVILSLVAYVTAVVSGA